MFLAMSIRAAIFTFVQDIIVITPLATRWTRFAKNALLAAILSRVDAYGQEMFKDICTLFSILRGPFWHSLAFL